MTTLLKSIVLVVAITGLTVRDVIRADEVRIDDLIVTTIDTVDVPAGQSGIIAKMNVREGQAVSAGELIASTDDRQARVRESMAATQVQIALHNADDALASAIAESELAAVQQLAKEQVFMQQVADRKATNDVRILASEKAAAVAKNELDRALQSRREFAESVSTSEIDGLRLAYEKMRLETRQAEVERTIDKLSARAAAEAAAGHAINIEKSEIALAQSQSNQQIARLNLQLGQLQNELAQLESARHRITSPMDGVVVEVHRKQGNWVNEGEPVARVLRLNRLRAEGFIELAKFPWLRDNHSVTLSIRTGPATQLTRAGEIVFISPEIDPVNDEVRFWVEFENPTGDVLPGMRLSVEAKR